MKISKRTPRSDMHYDAILQKMFSFFTEMAEQEGVDETTIDGALTKFASLSARVQSNGKDKLDFEFAKPTDTPEEIGDKFRKYLDTDHMDMVMQAKRQMRNMDAISRPDTSPQSLPEGAEKN